MRSSVPILPALLLVQLCLHSGPVSATAGQASQNHDSPDVVTQARELATTGERDRAVGLLEAHLKDSPTDGDARVLLGAILSWDQRYIEARTHLKKVLAASPDRGDALAALVNVELWSGRPERAEPITRSALRRRPQSTTVLMSRAKVLSALRREHEACDLLDRLLEIDPRNEDAEKMRRSLRDDLRRWTVSYGYSYDSFSDHRAAWNENQVSFKRKTPAGSLITRIAQAHRFSSRDEQVEIDFYPKFRPGTYAYLNVGYSPKFALFPRYRFGGDLYQSLGRGFEGSVGYRRLVFNDTVHIYVGSLSKYYGNFMFTGRIFLTPDQAGTSRSYHLSVRRYFGDGMQYVGLRGHLGWAKEEVRDLNDVAVLNARGVAGEVNLPLGRRWELNFRGGYSREERLERSDLGQFSFSSGIYLRF